MGAESHNQLGIAALVCYLVSAACYVIHLRTGRLVTGRLATALGAVGMALNFSALYSRARLLKTVPYGDLLGSMALFGFFLAVVNLILEVRHKDRSLGPFLMPAAFLVLLLSLVIPASTHAIRPELRGSLFAFHVTLVMLAYAAFAVSGSLAALYLAVGRSLKRTDDAFDGPLTRLPTLGYLERANRTSLGVGVVSLAIGMTCGGAWAMHLWPGQSFRWFADPKVIATLLLLTFYVVVLVRARRGAAPTLTAALTLAGFLLVVLSYTAINLVFSRFHTFT